jgi:molecular chaperone GrpE
MAKKDTKESEKIKKLEEQMNELSEKSLRTLADFENYKKRVREEQQNLNLLASSATFSILLEIFDDLERSMSQMENPPDGLVMIKDKILSILEQHNIEQIKVETDSKFDLKSMEAIGTVTVKEDKQDGKVIHVERQGYKYKDKDMIIRPTRVIVGKREVEKK